MRAKFFSKTFATVIPPLVSGRATEKKMNKTGSY